MRLHCEKCNEHYLDCKCEKEKVDHPTYYQGKKYEAIDIIEDYNLDFHLGNAIKYILRAGKKDDKLKDLNKAMWYLKRSCQNIENETKPNDTH